METDTNQKPKRTWYPTKEAWARAQAKAVRDAKAAAHDRLITGSFGKAGNYRRSQALMEEQARKFERMAEKFAARSV